MKKKTVVFNSDLPRLKTGLGRNAKAVMEYLYNTGKYNLIYYSTGTVWDSPEYQCFPFKVVGALPNDQQELRQLCSDPGQARFVSYGGYYIDRVIQEFKPDILIMSNDSWSSSGWWEKKWWNKISCVAHKTLDSLPFLPDQIKYLQNSSHFYVWADFAEKEAKRLGFNHVKTLTGAIDNKSFYKLNKFQKVELKNKFNLSQDSFICGFVFRNQLRKECQVLLEGFNNFLKENPKANGYLLLHTCFSENAGWNIPLLCDELGLDKSRILTTYVCRTCKQYEVKSFVGENQPCPCCKAAGEQGQITSNPGLGVSETELNEIYNLMDVYCHPFNAGGLEMPIVEALYAEIPVATVPYACGEMFTDNDFVYSLNITFNRQHGTQFKRAVIQPASITKFLTKIYGTDEQKRNDLGRRGREWALNKFSVEVIGKQWEELLDSLPFTTWDFNFAVEAKDPHAQLENLEKDDDFIEQLYVKILKVAGSDPEGKAYWLNLLKNGAPRDQIANQFRKIAMDDNQKNGVGQIKFEDLLDNTGNKRFLIVMKESIGDLLYLTALLKDFKKQYPNHDLYVACDPQYLEIFDGNEYIQKTIPYAPFMDSELAMTGQGANKGFFDGYCFPATLAQKHLSYLTNNKISLNLN